MYNKHEPANVDILTLMKAGIIKSGVITKPAIIVQFNKSEIKRLDKYSIVFGNVNLIAECDCILVSYEMDLTEWSSGNPSIRTFTLYSCKDHFFRHQVPVYFAEDIVND